MNFSKKALIAAAVTGVLPAASQAADLNVNLVLNPSFENVTGRDAADWTGNVTTYMYSQNYTGPAPPGAGNFYWNGGGADPLAFQILDLAGNAAIIDAGLLNYSLSAFQHLPAAAGLRHMRALFLDVPTHNWAAYPLAAPRRREPARRNWRSPRLGTGHDLRLMPSGTQRPAGTRRGKGAERGGVADPSSTGEFQIAPVPEPSTRSVGLGAVLALARLATTQLRH
jgi:hypothetical protein